MSTTVIANLKPGDGDTPIEIKVIRKWISYGKKTECCYVFLDKSGDAIEACSSFTEKNYFDSIIKVDSCYCLSNYMCENEKTYFITVPHKTRIKLGKAAKCEQIPDHEFPNYYFNFVAYHQLISRLDDHNILTDYIGKVENVHSVVRTKGTTLLKLKLENLSGTMMETTFWDEASMSFNKETVEALPSPVIVAVTSMKVTQYLGTLQLTATPASYIYINPTIPEATSMATEFVLRDNLNPVLNIEYEKSEDIDIEKQRNRFTLSDLLSQKPNHYGGVQFTCKAALVRIDETKGWFYKACHECRKKLQKRGSTLACEDHQQVNNPNNLYFITAYMADDTAQAKILFFDAAATMLLQTDCNTMIDQLGYTDPYTLPAPMNNLKGQTKIFQMRFTRLCKPGAIDFVADAVFEDTIILDKGIDIQTNIIPPTPATKTSIATVDLASITPATPTKIVPQHLSSTPITPAVTPIVESTETKHHEQTSTKRQLFQTSSSGQTSSQFVKRQKNCDDQSDENIKTPVGASVTKKQ